jgi:dephospho-CoA kinase
MIMTVLKIALTGGIACGKSQLAQIFAKFGVDVIQLDNISKEITAPKSAGIKELIDAFGKKIVHPNGGLNRAVLREILLASKSNQTTIERILHPKILTKMQEKIETLEKPLVIIEIPLLIEGFKYFFDRAIVVTCHNKNQLERLINRTNIDEKLAKKMIAAQINQEERLKITKLLPSDIVENNNTVSDLEQRAEQLYQKLINL